MDMLINGLTDLSYLLMSFIHTIIFELFLLFILLCLVVIYGVSMAQVLWAQLALGVLLILGPLFIPFLLVEPLAFLFWGWFKSMFTYTLYGAIAGGADAGVPRGEYRLDECHCEWSTARHKHALA